MPWSPFSLWPASSPPPPRREEAEAEAEEEEEEEEEEGRREEDEEEDEEESIDIDGDDDDDRRAEDEEEEEEEEENVVGGYNAGLGLDYDDDDGGDAFLPSAQQDPRRHQTTGIVSRILTASGVPVPAPPVTAPPVTAPPVTAAARPATKPPKDTLRAVYEAGAYKASLPLNLLAIQSVMAGIFISFAGQLFVVASSSGGGRVLGAFLFPSGLVAVILTSAELFTGDALIFVASVLGGKVRVRMLARNWCVAWVCNFVGSLGWAYFMAYLSTAVQDVEGAAAVAAAVAEKKVLHQSLGTIFLKGIGANFLVCVAIWQATCAEAVEGKVLALWFPVAGFVLLGFDHSVANMFLVPIGMMLGADVTVGQFVVALLVTTMGNVVGGGFVGAVYYYVFDTMSQSQAIGMRIRRGMTSTVRKSAASFRRTVSSSSLALQFGANAGTGGSSRRQQQQQHRSGTTSFRRRGNNVNDNNNNSEHTV